MNKYEKIIDALKELTIRDMEGCPVDIRHLIGHFERESDDAEITKLVLTPDELHHLTSGQSKIDVIKSVRARTGCSLRHAKMAVDRTRGL